MTTTKNNLNEALKKLAEIVRWFDDQKEVEVEAGLEKVREGAKLIKASRQRLAEIENSFHEIEADLEN